MIYWMRTRDIMLPALYLLMSILWSFGGWMVVSHAFSLRSRERLVSGAAAGFVLFITLSNLLANILPLTLAFWSASGIIFIAGLALALRSRARPPVDPGDLRAWPVVAVALGTSWIFTLILRGLAIFDDYYHLPLVSSMAAGDIPPHFQLDPAQHLAYHHALQVFAASLVRLGGRLHRDRAVHFRRRSTLAPAVCLTGSACASRRWNANGRHGSPSWCGSGRSHDSPMADGWRRADPFPLCIRERHLSILEHGSGHIGRPAGDHCVPAASILGPAAHFTGRCSVSRPAHCGACPQR